jgi:hypothetical protein
MSGGRGAAPKVETAEFPALDDAPGRYVLEP